MISSACISIYVPCNLGTCANLRIQRLHTQSVDWCTICRLHELKKPTQSETLHSNLAGTQPYCNMIVIEPIWTSSKSTKSTKLIYPDKGKTSVSAWKYHSKRSKLSSIYSHCKIPIHTTWLHYDYLLYDTSLLEHWSLPISFVPLELLYIGSMIVLMQ